MINMKLIFRYLVAIRDITAGKVIFTEYPSIIGMIILRLKCLNTYTEGVPRFHRPDDRSRQSGGRRPLHQLFKTISRFECLLQVGSALCLRRLNLKLDLVYLRCFWPVCSSECGRSRQHRVECSTLSSACVRWETFS